jgi:hypothetical protein
MAAGDITVTFEWETDPIGVMTENYIAYANYLYFALVKLVEQLGPDITEWMKENAAWQDRTTRARTSLDAIPAYNAQEIALLLAYNDPEVDYGVYLETVVFAHAGLLSIIGPAVDKFGVQLESQARALVGSVG